MPTANEDLVDLGIRHAVHLTRLRRQAARDVLAHLNDDVLPDLKARLAARLERTAARGFETGPWTTKRLREAIRVTRAQIARGMEQAGEIAVDAVRDVGLTEAQWQAAKINAAIPSGIDLRAVVPNARQVGAVVNARPFQGEVMRGWWKKLTSKAQTDISRAIQIGITEGETSAAIVRRVGATFDGLRRNVNATVQTATSHVSAQARELTYEANEDLVKGVQIVATLDAHTTEICMSEDGKVYPVGVGPRNPFHWGCRTTTVPVLKSLKEMGYEDPGLKPGTRASMSGQVPARQTYGTWLRKQPAAVQDDVLGKTKGALYRKHRLDVTSFVDDKRRVLTLPELRRREGLGVPSVTRPGQPLIKPIDAPYEKLNVSTDRGESMTFKRSVELSNEARGQYSTQVQATHRFSEMDAALLTGHTEDIPSARFLTRNPEGIINGAISFHVDDDILFIDHLGSMKSTMGSGSELMRYAVNDAVRMRIPLELESTPGAEGFYSRLGFIQDARVSKVFHASQTRLLQIQEALGSPGRVF